jgi:predicted acylesterase/phospholipase RssA
MTLRRILVLQGCGVRDIAHVGALESMPKDVSLPTVPGTSAGSMIAAPLAPGRRAEIGSLTKELDCAMLLDASEQGRITRPKSLS